MCLEDLRLGRGRVVGKSTSDNVSQDGIVKADPRRTTIIWSGIMSWMQDPVTGVVSTDCIFIYADEVVRGTPAFILDGGGTTLLVLRVEEFGELVTGPMSVQVVNNTNTLNWVVQEIFTNVEAAPIFTGREK